MLIGMDQVCQGFEGGVEQLHGEHNSNHERDDRPPDRRWPKNAKHDDGNCGRTNLRPKTPFAPPGVAKARKRKAKPLVKRMILHTIALPLTPSELISTTQNPRRNSVPGRRQSGSRRGYSTKAVDWLLQPHPGEPNV